MSTYHHGDLRTAVLAAAGKIVEDEGLAGLSVREAARRAGVSHNAPYRHFRDRDALLAALAIEGFAQLERALEGRSGRSLGEAYVRFAIGHPQRFRLMSASPRMSMFQGRFASTFAELAAGTEIAAAAAWSLVHGLAQLILDGHLKRDDDFVKKVIGAIRVAQRSA